MIHSVHVSKDGLNKEFINASQSSFQSIKAFISSKRLQVNEPSWFREHRKIKNNNIDKTKNTRVYQTKINNI